MKYFLLGLVLIFGLLGCSKKISELEKQLIQQGLVSIQDINPQIEVSLAYSQPDNVLGHDIYGDLQKAYMQVDVAKKLSHAQDILNEKKPGYKLIIYDSVRPLSVQKKMWDLVKGTDKQIYVANPKFGSIHNYGSAIDLSILNDKGLLLDMGTPFDFFGKLAQPRYEQHFLKEGRLQKHHIKNRQLLREVMKAAGFKGINVEWWHFNSVSRAEAKRRYSIIQ